MQSFSICNIKANYVMMNIVDRLKDYMDYIGMASTQFADVANIPRPTISQILNGRNRKISNEVIEKLHIGFPDLNIMWLLFGDGEMQTSSNNRLQEPSISGFSTHIHAYAGNNPQISPLTNSGVKPTASMQSSSIDEFVNDTVSQKRKHDDNVTTSNPPSGVALSTSNEKKIKYIMVFFSDNSFEVLTPAQSL